MEKLRPQEGSGLAAPGGNPLLGCVGVKAADLLTATWLGLQCGQGTLEEVQLPGPGDSHSFSAFPVSSWCPHGLGPCWSLGKGRFQRLSLPPIQPHLSWASKITVVHSEGQLDCS